MTDQFYIRARWGARRESASECAERTAQMMRDLAHCHKLLSRWNEAAGKSLAEALKRHITPTCDGLTPLLKPLEPIEGQRPEDMGYGFDCFNGSRTSVLGIILSMTCGRFDTFAGHFNQVLLKLPWQSPKVETLYRPEVLEGIMRAMVNAWAPDSVTLLSIEYLDRYTFPEFEQLPWPPPPEGPEVGWFTYLSADRLGKLSGTPPCDEVITLRDRGSFFIISREHLFSVDNPDDVARLRELKAYLEANHALEPLPEEKPQRKKSKAKGKGKPEVKAEPAAEPRRRKTAARPKTPSRRKQA